MNILNCKTNVDLSRRTMRGCYWIIYLEFILFLGNKNMNKISRRILENRARSQFRDEHTSISLTIFHFIAWWRYFRNDRQGSIEKKPFRAEPRVSKSGDRLTNDAVKGRFRARVGARWRGKRNNTAGGIRE